jgi:hypothetical protein
VSAISAREFAEKIAHQFNEFEAETTTYTHQVRLYSCCCDESLLISDGRSTYGVDQVFTGDPENPAYTWKAVERV